MTDQQILEAIQAMQSNTIQAMKEVVAPINDRLTNVEAHLARVDAHLDQVDARMAEMDTQLKELKEDTTVTREAVNTLLEWADDASIQVIPLFRKPQRHVE